MHVLIVTDQHADSLGGAQVSIRQQQAALTDAGHLATVVAPRLHRPHPPRAHDIDLPSMRITCDGEYGMSWPGRRIDRFLLQRLGQLPPVDIVHVQGDFWGALIGYRIARLLHAPVVHTLHNDVDSGTRAVTPLAGLVFVALRAWRRMLLGRSLPVSPRARGAWRYLAELTAAARVVISPSAHFARRLHEHGVEGAIVMPTGVDDRLIAQAQTGAEPQESAPVRLVWLGRMSSEKRIVEAVEAFAASERAAAASAELHVYGHGLLEAMVRRRIDELGISSRVRLYGAVSHPEALRAIARSDALLQTSVGFETQGMTVYEASALGTPVVFCDRAIADEVDVQPSWVTAGSSTADLVRAIDEAVAAIAQSRADGRELRVTDVDRMRWLQSRLTEQMLRRYRALIDERTTVRRSGAAASSDHEDRSADQGNH
ncbi:MULTISPECIES: glycosyltransferase [unclassified Pseudoclavibacter]|uniref:glycosyltransferase n=1 Tax=unclassified Pseudoclavibacter TaxID=2615177 RepID=UPI00130136AB|nr:MULTISPECIES: glycosyltransferase [unclassified Pseudoclavibacter]KAB1644451.1 glycosyltransferase family 4 protein [Pseudoclavibacter sp. CFCC 14310]KAB1664045.1 glycosyltransferase family 4 protein [Pseudoclavibacter sp. CFCC 13611]